MPGIEITADAIQYHPFPSSEIGLAMFCKGFVLPLSEIVLIFLSPRLALDDEVYFICLVTQKGRIFPMPNYVVSNSGAALLENAFRLPSIVEEYAKFEFEDHDGTKDIILYPPELVGENAFRKDLRWYLRRRHTLFGFTKSLYGNFTEPVKKLFQ